MIGGGAYLFREQSLWVGELNTSMALRIRPRGMKRKYIPDCIPDIRSHRDAFDPAEIVKIMEIRNIPKEP